MNEIVGLAVVLMVGLLLIVVAWQVLGIARDRAKVDGARAAANRLADVQRRLDALEAAAVQKPSSGIGRLTDTP